MDELTREIVDYFSFLYKSEGCKFIDSTYYPGGGIVVLESDKLVVKFVREKGETTVDIGPAYMKDVYFNLFWVRKLIGENPNFADNTKADKLADFLEKNFQKIISLVSPQALEQTIHQVERMKKEL
jgi:hypothetical protein